MLLPVIRVRYSESGTDIDSILTQYLDAAAGATQGGVLVRTGAGWRSLLPGASGTVLTSGGPNADPSFAAGGGGGGSGTVTGVLVANSHGVSAVSDGDAATPTLTFTLTAITPTTIVASGAISGSNLSGTNTGDQTFAELSPLTTLGDLLYFDASANQRLAGNITTTKKFLSQTGAGASSNAPIWGQPAFSDVTGTVATAQIGAAQVTYAKIQNVAGSALLGNATGSPAAPSEITLDPTLTFTGTTLAIPANVALAGSPTTTTQASSDSSTKLATTSFVQTVVNNAIAGVNPAVAVQAATAAKLPNSPTYNNGTSGIGAFITTLTFNTALVVDSYTPILNDRILVKNEADSGGLGAAKNGVYTVTQVAAVGLAWILTRALDFDQPSDMNNTGAIPVINGTVNVDTSWVMTSTVNTVGTDAVTFTKFSLNPATLLSNSLTSAFIFVGNGSNQATGVAMSGGATISNTGVVTLANPSASTLGGIQSAVAVTDEFIDSISTSGVPHLSVPRGPHLFTAVLGQGAAITTGANSAGNYLVCPFSGTFTRWDMVCPTANQPSGASLVVDVLKSAAGAGSFTSLWATNTGNRPTITTGTNNGGSATAFDTTTFSAGDVLRFDVITAGGGAVQNVTVVISSRMNQ